MKRRVQIILLDIKGNKGSGCGRVQGHPGPRHLGTCRPVITFRHAPAVTPITLSHRHISMGYVGVHRCLSRHRTGLPRNGRGREKKTVFLLNIHGYQLFPFLTGSLYSVLNENCQCVQLSISFLQEKVLGATLGM